MKSFVLAALLIGCSLATCTQADEVVAGSPAIIAGAAGYAEQAFPTGIYGAGYSNLTTYTSWPQMCCTNVWDGYCDEKGHCSKLCEGKSKCHYAVGRCKKSSSCNTCGSVQACGCAK